MSPATDGKVCRHCRKRLPACDCPPALVSPELWAFRYLMYPEEWPAEERIDVTGLRPDEVK